MPAVLVQCQRIQAAVWTGLDLTAAELEQTPPGHRIFRCSACGELHIWTVEQAWLSDEPSQQSRYRPLQRRGINPPRARQSRWPWRRDGR